LKTFQRFVSSLHLTIITEEAVIELYTVYISLFAKTAKTAKTCKTSKQEKSEQTPHNRPDITLLGAH